MAKPKSSPPGVKALASNRSAAHHYFLEDRFEAGIALLGPEVKSIRAGKINLKESYARIKRGEVWLVGAHVSPYEHGSHDNPDPLRERKLLLHAREIGKLERETTQGGRTIVTTRAYLKNGRIKIEIALARGKKLHDKRETKKKQESDREMARARASHRR